MQPKVTEKECTKCGINKNLEEDFNKNKTTFDGYSVQCKKCGKDYYYQKAARKKAEREMYF